MANINRILKEAEIHPMDVITAKRMWRDFRVSEGWGPKAPLLTPPGANQKLAKDGRVASYGLALAQASTVGTVPVKVWTTVTACCVEHFPEHAPGTAVRVAQLVLMKINTCPFSTPACRHGCVSQEGNGRYDRTQQARQLKTRFLMSNPDAFMSLLAHEIDKARAKHGRALRVRLNTFSDIRWEEVAPWLIRSGGRRYVKFYDYSKDWGRVLPSNYRLTLSVSERTSDAKAVAAAATRSVAVVFSTSRTKALPATWNGLTVVDGDKSDNRSDDGPGIIGLRAKGAMRSEPMGMVRSA